MTQAEHGVVDSHSIHIVILTIVNALNNVRYVFARVGIPPSAILISGTNWDDIFAGANVISVESDYTRFGFGARKPIGQFIVNFLDPCAVVFVGPYGEEYFDMEDPESIPKILAVVQNLI